MTTITAFRRSLSDAAPPEDLALAVRALWWAGKGDWNRAHECAQEREGDPACDLVHGYLHRQEGDLENAGYWYHRAGRTVPTIPLQEEWEALTVGLVAA